MPRINNRFSQTFDIAIDLQKTEKKSKSIIRNPLLSTFNELFLYKISTFITQKIHTKHKPIYLFGQSIIYDEKYECNDSIHVNIFDTLILKRFTVNRFSIFFRILEKKDRYNLDETISLPILSPWNLNFEDICKTCHLKRLYLNKTQDNNNKKKNVRKWNEY